MGTTLTDLTSDLSGLDPTAWWTRIDELGEEHGYHLSVGERHSAVFLDLGPQLLVTFEEEAEIRRRPGARPRGFDLAAEHGWSSLTIIADGATWFRDEALYRFFDRQVDDGFFEDFDAVTFFGHGMGAYGAAAYSVTAPGARVLLVSPIASLAPDVASWDRRHLSARALDFASRYGYAPDMAEAAARTWTVSDPGYGPDAMHAALFRRPNTMALRAPHTRGKLAPFLDHLGITRPMIAAAMAGTLTRTSFARLWRARHDSPAYLRGLLARAEAEGRPDFIARICRHGLTTRDAAPFRERLAHLAERPAETPVG